MKTSKTRGATKVPNVKLRPAQASSSRSIKRQTSLPRVGLRDEDPDQHEFDIGLGNRPFEGVVLCATGDLDKRTLFSQAQELGAIRANDFTDQVTHLVADSPGSAKYRCAVERSLPILKASWVHKAYQTWLDGDVVDLEQAITDNRLPIFPGVRLCITGIEDMDLRGKIHSLLLKENGVYLKSLDKTATHLLCCVAEESPKMKWANDYNRTQGEGKICLVWEEWFWDSLEFGGRWAEHEYKVTSPRPARKTLSQIIRPMNPDSSQTTLPIASLSQRTPLPRSLPTSALLGDEQLEYGKVNRVADAGLRIFESIVEKRGYAARSDGALQSTQNDVKSKPLFTPSTPKVHKLISKPIAGDPDADPDSVLARLSNHRATSFACSPLSQLQSRQPFRRISSCTTALDPQTSFMGGASTGELCLFAGYTFRAFGEAKGPALRSALEACGGRWLTDDDEDEDADFLVVRLVSGGLYWRDESDERERAKFRTECWVERCIFEERICAGDEHIVFTPLQISTPIAESAKLYINLSGLDSAETCWVKRLVRALGGNLPPTFSRHSTHLICPSGCGAKYDKAKEWGVNVVGKEWLIAVATTGEVPHPKDYQVMPRADSANPINLPKLQDGKWKEKDKEGDRGGTIVDITNDVSQELQTSKGRGASFPLEKYDNEGKRLTPDISQSTRVKPLSRGAGADTVHLEERTSELMITFGSPSGPLLDPSPNPSRRENEFRTATPPQIPRTASSVLSAVTPKSKHTTRQFSAAEVEQDMKITFIPSSHSPSPLKIPSKAASVPSPSMSETRGLRSTITALLGKRGNEVRDETDGPPQKSQGRSSKRPRLAARGKTNLDSLSPTLSFMSGTPPLSHTPTPFMHEDLDTITEEEQTSLRVVYEDPGQTAEKRKLIALFERGAADDGSRPVGGAKGRSHAGKGTDQAPTDTKAKLVPKKKLARRSNRTPGVQMDRVT